MAIDYSDASVISSQQVLFPKLELQQKGKFWDKRWLKAEQKGKDT
jgi:hypothetical protein